MHVVFPILNDVGRGLHALGQGAVCPIPVRTQRRIAVNHDAKFLQQILNPKILRNGIHFLWNVLNVVDCNVELKT